MLNKTPGHELILRNNGLFHHHDYFVCKSSNMQTEIKHQPPSPKHLTLNRKTRTEQTFMCKAASV